MISTSSYILTIFVLIVNYESYERILQNPNIFLLPIRNISVTFSDAINPKKISNLLKYYKNSLENLTLKNLKVNNFCEFSNIFNDLSSLKSLNLENCKICDNVIGFLSSISTLKFVSFLNSDGKFFTILKNCKSIEKLKIRCYENTWNGFSHAEFNSMVKGLPNLHHLVLDGDGTSSYFDSDEYPFKVKILETTSITFHWYVGIKTARLAFLKSQLESLKVLTIHKLPFDFDGGKVLKFIIEQMNLVEFYYGKIPLILNGIKQKVVEFSATETQIQAVFEMFQQFTSIKRFTLILNNTDICSESIEKIINPKTLLFDNLEEFSLIDKSQFRGLFGVFLSLFQNLRNIKKLTFDTQDRNIAVILEECLPQMKKLEEICLTSTAPNPRVRFEAVKKSVKNLKKLTIPTELMALAKTVFGDRIEILGI